MRADLPSRLPLICPACRVRDAAGLHLATVSVTAVLRRAPDDPDEIEEGVLGCDNAACGHSYPILAGVPVLTVDPAGPLRGSSGLAALAMDLSPEVAALLCASGPDDEALPRLHEHLSIYLDAHYGDRADPPPDGPAAPFGMSAIVARLSSLPPTPRAVELGCGVGRGLFELAQQADLVVGVDLHFAALRRAGHLLRGNALRYSRRVIGRHYQPALLPPWPRPPGEVALICADALDPPLPPGTFDRAVALNLLDAVTWPAQLLGVADGLLAPGGELVLSSPYAWQSGIVAEEGRLGAAEPQTTLRTRLETGEGLIGSYQILEEGDLPWELRRDTRCAHRYLVHYLRAQRRRP